MFQFRSHLGAVVEKKQVIGTITDAFGNRTVAVKSNVRGIIIGHVQNPLVNQGDALVHIALL